MVGEGVNEYNISSSAFWGRSGNSSRNSSAMVSRCSAESVGIGVGVDRFRRDMGFVVGVSGSSGGMTAGIVRVVLLDCQVIYVRIESVPITRVLTRLSIMTNIRLYEVSTGFCLDITSTIP